MMGREFAPQDRQGTELVAVVDTVLARQYWPGKNPIGEHIGFNDHAKGPWYTIVGLVAHARASSLESDTNEGFYYLERRASAAAVERHRGAQFAFAGGLEGRPGRGGALGGFQRPHLRREDHGAARGRVADGPPLCGAAADLVCRTGAAAGRARAVRRDQLFGARCAPANSVCAWRWARSAVR